MSAMSKRRTKCRPVATVDTSKCVSYLMQQHRDSERWGDVHVYGGPFLSQQTPIYDKLPNFTTQTLNSRHTLKRDGYSSFIFDSV